MGRQAYLRGTVARVTSMTQIDGGDGVDGVTWVDRA